MSTRSPPPPLPDLKNDKPSEEQLTEAPLRLVIPACHSRALISNHDLQMFHPGASLIVCLHLPTKTFFWKLSKTFWVNVERCWGAGTLSSPPTSFFNITSMTFLFYQAACRRNCQEIHGRQDDIQQQSRCWISCDTAAKSACLCAGKGGYRLSARRVEKKKKEYLSGLTFAPNSTLLKLIIFTEINSNYLSFYGLQFCSAKNPIMHLSVSVKEVSVCDCFHTKAVISNWLDYICLKRWQIGSIRSMQDKLLKLPVFNLLIDVYKTVAG